MSGNKKKLYQAAVPAAILLAVFAFVSGCTFEALPVWNGGSSLRVALTLESALVPVTGYSGSGRFILPETKRVELSVRSSSGDILVTNTVFVSNQTDSATGAVVMRGTSDALELPVNMLLDIEAVIRSESGVIISRADTRLMLTTREPRTIHLRMLPTTDHPAVVPVTLSMMSSLDLPARTSVILRHQIPDSFAGQPVGIDFDAPGGSAGLQTDLRDPSGTPMRSQSLSFTGDAGVLSYTASRGGVYYFIVYNNSDSDRMLSNLVLRLGAGPSSSKQITSFIISDTGSVGSIAGTNISVIVPAGTGLLNLTPIITHTGVSITPASGVAGDFVSPVVYTVTAEDSSTMEYTVTVTEASAGSKEITSFSITSPFAAGTITGTDISVTVPYGTVVTSLVPSISHTGSSINPLPSIPQDFSVPVQYTVTAADSTTQVYTVTVTVAPPSSNANLQSLTISALTLLPAFNSTTYNYTVLANSSNPTTTVNPSADHPGAAISVKINAGSFATVVSGTNSGTLVLDASDGYNIITIHVLAEDGITTQDYILNVTKTVGVSITASAGGTAWMTPADAEQQPGTFPSVQASANPGYRFSHWAGPGLFADIYAASTSWTVPVTGGGVVANFVPDFFGGDGSAGSPFIIQTLAHLQNVRHFLSAHYLVSNNIDLTSVPNWTPIGTAATPFTGTFDGGSLEISNLTISAGGSDAGLFGVVENATLQHIRLTSVSIVASDSVGALAGRVLGTSMISVTYASGSIEGKAGTGGLIGSISTAGGTEVYRSGANVTITSSDGDNKGGLVGSMTGDLVKIQESYAHGNVTGDLGFNDQNIGGLVGSMSGGTITNCYAIGDVSGYNNVGGLVGSAVDALIKFTHAVGSVTVDSTGGSLVAHIFGTTAVDDSYYNDDANAFTDYNGYPLLLTEMSTTSNFPTWEFGTIWNMLAYPVFPWE